MYYTYNYINSTPTSVQDGLVNERFGLENKWTHVFWQNHRSAISPVLESREMDPCETIFETLIKKGWSFRDPVEIKTLIRSNNSLESVESELLNMDLRSIGAKSIPDSTSLKKSSHLVGPKILQVIDSKLVVYLKLAIFCFYVRS